MANFAAQSELMESTIAEWLGISTEVFHWAIVPLLIFLARISDVSISTLRIMLMMSGRMRISAVMGFFESMVWLLAISQILQNINNPITYIAYAGGFATGIYVGMLIEEKLAVGNVILRIITQKNALALTEALRAAGFRLTTVDALGSKGPVQLLFMVIARDQIPEVISLVETNNPKAFYSIENVRYVRDEERLISPESISLASRFSIRRFWQRK